MFTEALRAYLQSTGATYSGATASAWSIDLMAHHIDDAIKNREPEVSVEEILTELFEGIMLYAKPIEETLQK